MDATTPPSDSAMPNTLPRIHRYITTHDTRGKAVYSNAIPEALNFWTVGAADGQAAGFELGYTTAGLPTDLNGDQDLLSFKHAYEKKQESGLVKHGGTILRFCDIPPRGTSPMHRTNSLDYGILITGSLECLLDSGESRTIYPGEVIVQRATNHQWRNNTDTWARIVFILFDATTLEINGVPLQEDIGGIELPPSH